MKFVKLIFVLYCCFYCSYSRCQPTTKFLDEFDIQPVKRQFVLSNSLLFNHEIKYGLSKNFTIGLGLNTYLSNGNFRFVTIGTYRVKIPKYFEVSFNSKIEPISFNGELKYFQYLNFNLGLTTAIKPFTSMLIAGTSKYYKWNYFNLFEILKSAINQLGEDFDQSEFNGKYSPYLGIAIAVYLKKNNFLIWDYYLQNLKESDGTEKYFKMRDIAYRHIFKNFGFDVGIYRYSTKGYWPKATLFYGIGKNKKLVSPF